MNPFFRARYPIGMRAKMGKWCLAYESLQAVQEIRSCKINSQSEFIL